MPNVILIKRTKLVKSHAGEISFPGGNFMKTDTEMLETAIRETSEEVGIQIKKEQVPASDLIDITNQINKHSNHRIGKLIFYDLDSTNLVQYETAIFEKALDNLN